MVDRTIQIIYDPMQNKWSHRWLIIKNTLLGRHWHVNVDIDGLKQEIMKKEQEIARAASFSWPMTPPQNGTGQAPRF